MVNKFLQAITTQLHSEFGDSYKYYVENVKQNLTKPCFTIDTLTPLQRSRNRTMYDRTIPIVVHYFSNETSTTKADAYGKAEQIVETLEYVPFENTLIRGENISWQNVDDVLQVLITYRFRTVKTASNEDNMDEVTTAKISHT